MGKEKKRKENVMFGNLLRKCHVWQFTAVYFPDLEQRSALWRWKKVTEFFKPIGYSQREQHLTSLITIPRENRMASTWSTAHPCETLSNMSACPPMIPPLILPCFSYNLSFLSHTSFILYFKRSCLKIYRVNIFYFPVAKIFRSFKFYIGKESSVVGPREDRRKVSSHPPDVDVNM